MVIYDLLGREVVQLATGKMYAGTHEKIWNGKDHRSKPQNYIIKIGHGTVAWNRKREGLILPAFLFISYTEYLFEIYA